MDGEGRRFRARVTVESSSVLTPRMTNFDVRPFVYGGTAACIAELATFPIDTAKTRLQLQGQIIETRYSKIKYNGMLHCLVSVRSEEGFRRLYSGLSPALLRQVVYGTIKYGLYDTIKKSLPSQESPVQNIFCAVTAGAISSAIANPTDLLKVRMQSISIQDPKVGLYNISKDIYTKEGLTGFWRGVGPMMMRSSVMAGVQLPVYDQCKLFFIRQKILKSDSPANHTLSSICASFCACLVSSPFDVVRTRLMDQRKLIQRNHYVTNRIYKSAWDCVKWTIRKEGIHALYRGFLPAFLRTGPWNIIFFIVFERFKKMSFSNEK